MPCEPGWEQSDASLYKPPGGTYLKMLESRWCIASLLWQLEMKQHLKVFTELTSMLVPWGHHLGALPPLMKMFHVQSEHLISQLWRAGFRGLAGGPLLAKHYVWLINFLHHCSCMEGPEPYEAGTSTALFTTHSTEQPVPFGTEAVMEPGACFGSPVLLPGEAVSKAAASSWQGSFALYSYESLPTVNYLLPVWQAPYSTGGVSGSMWTPNVEG